MPLLAEVMPQDEFEAPVSPEIRGIHGGGLVRTGLHLRIQPSVACRQVQVAVAIQVLRAQDIPPAFRIGEAGFVGGRLGPLPVVAEHPNRHPFSCENQFVAPVPIHIRPQGVRHHPRRPQKVRRSVHERTARILQHVAARSQRVAARKRPPAHEQVHIPVPVEIVRRRGAPAAVQRRQGLRGMGVRARPVVDVQAVLVRRQILRFERAPAHHIQILVAVAVRIYKERVRILVAAVRFERRARSPAKRSVRALQKERARLPPRPADEYILQPVSVRIPRRQRRPLPGQHMRQQRLALEIHERVFDMREL